MPFATAIKHISINYYTPFKIYGESFIFIVREQRRENKTEKPSYNDL